MAIEVFEKEVKKAQSRFNQTFGPMEVCDLKTRQQAILTIVGMSRLADKIRTAPDKNQVKNEIKIFFQKKAFLSRVFNTIDEHQKERRHDENTDSRHQGQGIH